ncbi:hypothetical protein HanXRQr2_Chr11g0506621 [Helianthus annuus]|uniref:Uncharacterized protein n=1 Tax=Helianthus annuus TaxID=4232 RepID=A0A251STW4_HELAN|nr:uncharacterized protein LOC110899119 isoform X1 [Helianthus annuus]KAF5783327.1 hypothetical protein HanXRQr2_Chr11g0506621 [Helianthus annuus]KAJ0502657.1 hypothetical protein HanHA300_Chr11g0415381 [Helianthus annuus]KAJ0518617.1 hypothetical protein HanHA89_Chr11g0439441 [Helianthus annuus]KAJ0686660.1 hypothetical protein HanLR1_Chr11g0417201 [Helianthus annuus]KAJ0690473.1 hypothetical protein HanOQP8_Chr11g0418191 [Helianthus annuus]
MTSDWWGGKPGPKMYYGNCGGTTLLQEICMVNHNRVPHLQDLLNMLSYKRFLSQAPICMEHHNQLGIMCTRVRVECHLGFSPPHRQVTLHHQKSIYGINLLSIVIRQFSWRTVVKQEQRFMLKLSRMSAMLSPREMMTVLNMTVAQLKMFQAQLKMVQISSSSEDGSEYESTREVVDSEANESISVNPVRMFQEELLIVLGLLMVERPCTRSAT